MAKKICREESFEIVYGKKGSQKSKEKGQKQSP
jgi:hypothetical protein